MVPNVCRKTHEDLFREATSKRGIYCLCGRNFVGKSRTQLFGKVWENSGKNPCHPQNIACSNTHALIVKQYFCICVFYTFMNTIIHVSFSDMSSVPSEARNMRCSLPPENLRKAIFSLSRTFNIPNLTSYIYRIAFLVFGRLYWLCVCCMVAQLHAPSAQRIKHLLGLQFS